MHGVSSIISHTKHKVRTTLKKSHQILQAAIERNPKVGNGGPPGGIPVTPAATVKLSSTLKTGGVRKKRDCFQIEVITINDVSTKSEGKRGDTNDHDTTYPNENTTDSELNNNRDTKQSWKQVDHEKKDKAVWENKGERTTDNPKRATKSRIGKTEAGGRERSGERERRNRIKRQ